MPASNAIEPILHQRRAVRRVHYRRERRVHRTTAGSAVLGKSVDLAHKFFDRLEAVGISHRDSDRAAAILEERGPANWSAEERSAHRWATYMGHVQGALSRLTPQNRWHYETALEHAAEAERMIDADDFDESRMWEIIVAILFVERDSGAACIADAVANVDSFDALAALARAVEDSADVDSPDVHRRPVPRTLAPPGRTITAQPLAANAPPAARVRVAA